MHDILKRNISSGIVVFLVALPLCLGIALAQGAPLLSGLVSGIVGGVVVGFLGASHVSVSGPAAGLTAVVIMAISQLGGFQAFTLAVIISGLMQVGFSFLKAGVVSKFIPGSVIRGMLSAIGIIIILKQVPHLLGYDSDFVGDLEFIAPDGTNTISELLAMLRYLNPTAILISIISLALIVGWDKYLAPGRKILQSIPGSLLAVLAAVAMNHIAANVDALKNLSANHLVQLPVNLGLADFSKHFTSLNFSAVLSNAKILSIALTIAVIGSIETLLSLEAADKIDPLRRISNKNRELMAQGVGNMLSGFLGGLPITAVIVRTVTNVNSGGTHRISAIWHGLLLIIATFLIPQILNQIPLAALAMILAIVGYKLTSLRIFRIEWEAGKEQFLPFIATVLGVFLTDILIGVLIGCAVSIAFILIKNYHQGFFAAIRDGELHIRLASDISFIHRPGLSEELRQIPEGSRVSITAENDHRLHPDIAELIHEFRESASLRNIEIRESHMPLITPVPPHIGTRKDFYKKLIHGNKNWVRQTLETDRFYFEKLAEGQTPQALWIGCADSRVPPNEITNTGPGEIFIHRNVANLVVHSDLNMLSVLQYAVEVLKIRHVIVCGHYECGGVRAAMGSQDLGLANNWLRPIKEVYHQNTEELDSIADLREREKRLVELNVVAQVHNLAKTSIIQRAWKKRAVDIHGWVVELETGYIKELKTKLDEAKDLDRIFRYKV